MTEQFATTYAANLARQQGWKSFDAKLRTFGLNPGETQQHQVVDGVWLMIDANAGIRISSDNGEWDRSQTALPELSHEHSGQIALENRGTERQFVTFMQVTWLAEAVGIPLQAA